MASRGILETFKPEEGVEIDFHIFSWTDNRSYTTGPNVVQEESEESLRQAFESIYSPVTLQIDREDEVLRRYRVSSGNLSNDRYEFFQLYHISQVIQQAVRYPKYYDWIVWVRLDLQLCDFTEGIWKAPKLDYSKLQTIQEGGDLDYTLFLPDKVQTQKWAHNRIMVLDFMFFGNTRLMERFSTTAISTYFRYLDRYNETLECVKFPDRSPLYLESFLPIWAVENRVGLGFWIPTLEETHDSFGKKVGKQCFEEAGIDMYTREGWEFTETYSHLYFYDMDKEDIQELYRQYLQGCVYDFFREQRHEIIGEITREQIKEVLYGSKRHGVAKIREV